MLFTATPKTTERPETPSISLLQASQVEPYTHWNPSEAYHPDKTSTPDSSVHPDPEPP